MSDVAASTVDQPTFSNGESIKLITLDEDLENLDSVIEILKNRRLDIAHAISRQPASIVKPKYYQEFGPLGFAAVALLSVDAVGIIASVPGIDHVMLPLSYLLVLLIYSSFAAYGISISNRKTRQRNPDEIYREMILLLDEYLETCCEIKSHQDTLKREHYGSSDR